MVPALSARDGTRLRVGEAIHQRRGDGHSRRRPSIKRALRPRPRNGWTLGVSAMRSRRGDGRRQLLPREERRQPALLRPDRRPRADRGRTARQRSGRGRSAFCTMPMPPWQIDSRARSRTGRGARQFDADVCRLRERRPVGVGQRDQHTDRFSAESLDRGGYQGFVALVAGRAGVARAAERRQRRVPAERVQTRQQRAREPALDEPPEQVVSGLLAVMALAAIATPIAAAEAPLTASLYLDLGISDPVTSVACATAIDARVTALLTRRVDFGSDGTTVRQVEQFRGQVTWSTRGGTSYTSTSAKTTILEFPQGLGWFKPGPGHRDGHERRPVPGRRRTGRRRGVRLRRLRVLRRRRRIRRAGPPSAHRSRPAAASTRPRNASATRSAEKHDGGVAATGAPPAPHPG